MYEVRRDEPVNIDPKDFNSFNKDQSELRKKFGIYLTKMLLVFGLFYVLQQQKTIINLHHELDRYKRENSELKSAKKVSITDAFKKQVVTKNGAYEPPQYSTIKSKILSAKTVGCDIVATFNNGEELVIAKLAMSNKEGGTCIENSKFAISNFGKYLVYKDLSGGVDSIIKIYALEKAESVTLDVYGTSTIIDYVFLTDDVLAVLYGYPDIPKEQHLQVYDINALYNDYENNLIANTKYFKTTGEFVKNLQLTDFGLDYKRLRISTESLIAHTEEPDKFVVYSLEQYSF